MAKLPSITILIALSIAATLAGAAPAEESTFVVEGKVYCDTCRAGFETTVTNYIPGAKVRLECRDRSTHEVLHGADGVTDSEGSYRVEVAGEREDEICEVRLVSSPDEGCSEIKAGRDRARVAVTANSGIASNVRYANSLGFFKRSPLDICGPLLAQYNLADED